MLEQNRVETSRLYVPIDSEKLLEKLRHVLTHEQIDAMLADVRGRQVDWIDNRAERQSRYTEIARGGITGELLLLIHRLYLRRAELAARGRRLPEADLSLLKLAESLVNEEFSQALGIPPDAVADYIRAKLEE